MHMHISQDVLLFIRVFVKHTMHMHDLQYVSCFSLWPKHFLHKQLRQKSEFFDFFSYKHFWHRQVKHMSFIRFKFVLQVLHMQFMQKSFWIIFGLFKQERQEHKEQMFEVERKFPGDLQIKHKHKWQFGFVVCFSKCLQYTQRHLSQKIVFKFIFVLGQFLQYVFPIKNIFMFILNF